MISIKVPYIEYSVINLGGRLVISVGSGPIAPEVKCLHAAKISIDRQQHLRAARRPV